MQMNLRPMLFIDKDWECDFILVIGSSATTRKTRIRSKENRIVT